MLVINQMYCLVHAPNGNQTYGCCATTETKWSHLTFQFTSRNHLSSCVAKLAPLFIDGMNKIANDRYLAIEIECRHKFPNNMSNSITPAAILDEIRHQLSGNHFIFIFGLKRSQFELGRSSLPKLLKEFYGFCNFAVWF